MNKDELMGCLSFLQQAEKLKDVLRSAHTSSGRQESTAEHTWRLCLLAMVFEAELGDIDFVRLLKLAVIHDLGEAISGDIPAILQVAKADKSEQERNDLLELLSPLDPKRQGEFLALWDDYENGVSPEAKLVKGLDKLETIMQHNQGKNPDDFNYRFNLEYGRQHMGHHPLLEQIRDIMDQDTLSNAEAQDRQ